LKVDFERIAARACKDPDSPDKRRRRRNRKIKFYEKNLLRWAQILQNHFVKNNIGVKRFAKFTHRQFKSLISHLKKYRNEKKAETLHKIRVDIKKIKAILGVVKASDKRFKAHKNFIPLREISRKAGEIRDREIHAQLLLKHNLEDTRPRNANVNKLITSFESNIPSFIKTTKRKRNKLKADVKQVKKNDIRRYLHEKQKEIKSQLFPRPRMRNIHQTRKTVKEVVYLSEANGKLGSKEIKFYDKMQDTIGKLHDKQLLLQLLKKKNDHGKTQSEVIKAECLSDKKEIFRLAAAFYRLNPRKPSI
jgi:CHAD domain-containing protein